MNLKENKEISLYARLPLIFVLCSAAIIALRAVQMFSCIDRETGFYTGGAFIKVVLYAIVIAACVLFAVTAYLSSETRKVSLFLKKDRLIVLVSVLLSAGFVFDSLSSLYGALDSQGASSYGVSVFQSMMLSGTIPQFFQSIFAVLSAVYFIIFAKGVIKESNNASKHKLLAVAPVGWAGFRLIFRFVEQISYVRVSELLFELVYLAFAVMFFMAFAQVASGVYVKNVRWRIIGLGLPAALIALMLNVPRLIFALTVGADALYAKYPFRVSDFILSVFIAVIAVKLIRNENEPFEA